ncbi:MAG: hypothetical protein IPI12_09395 [Ignavibacteriales bacterium]|nr:hypothetical protein [Ignavibacteriales bacterium]
MKFSFYGSGVISGTFSQTIEASNQTRLMPDMGLCSFGKGWLRIGGFRILADSRLNNR